MTEREAWTTAVGYRAVILRHPMFGHLCGYVELPLGHILGGVDYSDHHESLRLYYDSKGGDEQPIGQRGILELFNAALKRHDTPDIHTPALVIDVHGSITYSGGDTDYPIPADAGTWWFGFDCNHYGDRDEITREPLWTYAMVANECEKLAQQLKEVDELWREHVRSGS